MKHLRAMLPFMKAFWLPALLAPLFMALEVSMDLWQPRMLQQIIDTGIPHRDLPFVLHTGFKMLQVAALGVVGGIGCTIFASIAGMNFGAAIRGALFKHVQTLSFGNLDRLETGGIITRLTNDVEQVQEAAMMFLRILVRAPLLSIGALLMAAITAPKLSLLLLIIGPLLLLVLIMINRHAHPLFSRMQEALDQVNSVVQENLAGVRVVKAYVRTAHENGRFAQANEKYRDNSVTAAMLMAVIMPILMLLLNLGIVAALWFGGLSVVHGNLHLGQLLAFNNYLLQMLFSLMMIGMLLMRVARADASAERLLEVLHNVPDVVDSPQAIAAAPVSGALEVDDISFSYGGVESSPVIHHLSFQLPAGQTMAILGATGSGKSTLAHLIPRLYDVDSGEIRFDGVDVRLLKQDSLRGQIAIVMQDTVLFSGSIADNLRYGRSQASDAEIEEAARMAQAHEFIMQLPQGYQAELGQRGVNLSGGQKQRLAIARALVARSALLILDDCTSAVDLATEAAILAELQQWTHSCSKIIIAQRVGAIRQAAQIMVLEQGCVAALGTHEKLLHESEIYLDIVRSQFSAEEVAGGN